MVVVNPLFVLLPRMLEHLALSNIFVVTNDDVYDVQRIYHDDLFILESVKHNSEKNYTYHQDIYDLMGFFSDI